MSSSVLIRADLNVPMYGTTITNDYKLRLCAETYHTVAQHYSRIVFATHQGRPTGSASDPTTHAHAQWFTKHGISTDYIALDDLIQQQPTNGTFMLPNLRRYSGEQSDDEVTRDIFAHTLKKTADTYLFDALAVAHRFDTSVSLLPCLYEPSARLISTYTKEQIALLQQFKHTVGTRLVILGGTKAPTKLAYVPDLLKQGIHVALLPPLSLAFQPKHAASLAMTIPSSWLAAAQKVNLISPDLLKRLILPCDYTSTTPAHAATDMPFISVETKSIHTIERAIFQADAILYNGLMGSISYPKTLNAIEIIFQALTQSPAQPCIIAGGDSVAAALEFNLEQSGLALSAVGGAALAYIAGQSLPAFTCLSLNR